MKYSFVLLAAVAGLVAAAPAKTKGGSIIEQLQATFDRNNRKHASPAPYQNSALTPTHFTHTHSQRNPRQGQPR